MSRVNRVTMRPLYGVGYTPMGDLVDVLDPFGVRKVPGEIKHRLDQALDARTQKAARVVGANVEAGVRRAMGEAEKKAITVVAAAAVGTVVVGGLAWLLLGRKEPS